MNPYRRGLEPLAEAGLVMPMPNRVLLRAIMTTDDSVVSEGVAIDAKQAVAHFVVAIDEATAEKVDLHHGDVVIHISAAGDALTYDDKAARHVVVHVDDIVCKVDHYKAIEWMEAQRLKALGLEALIVKP